MLLQQTGAKQFQCLYLLSPRSKTRQSKFIAEAKDWQNLKTQETMNEGQSTRNHSDMDHQTTSPRRPDKMVTRGRKAELRAETQQDTGETH